MDSRSVLLHHSSPGVVVTSHSSVKRAFISCSASRIVSSINNSAKPTSENCCCCHHEIGQRRAFSNSVTGFTFGSEALGRRWQKKDINKMGIGGERRPAVFRAAAAATAASDPRVTAAEEFSAWLKDQGFPEQAVAVKMFGEEGLGLAALRPLRVGEVALTVPENYCVTTFDINNHQVISSAASGRGDLIGLTLWLMYERAQGKASPWYPFVQLFPEATLSPLLWTATELEEQLRGSSVLEETRQRVAAIEEEYEELKMSYFDKDPKAFPAEAFSLSAFKNAFAVIMSRAFYLPSADIFALVPYGDCVNHRGDVEAYLDYSTADQAVVLNVDRDYKAGQQVFVNYGQDRPNSDLLISYGFVDGANSNNYLETEWDVSFYANGHEILTSHSLPENSPVELLPVDRLKVLKQQILDQAGFSSPQTFPLFENRFPTQLLTYVRLSRVTDVGLFAKIVFDRDVIIDQANEYEILMLLMGDCRVRLQGYSGNTDDETRIATDKKCSPKEKVAAQLRLSEKKILINTMSALRNRLAPIRGIPVKGGGLKDPNSDLLEIFDVAEQVASAPAKFLASIFNKK